MSTSICEAKIDNAQKPQEKVLELLEFEKIAEKREK